MAKTKRLLSYILVLAMILSSFGAFVFAEDDTGQKTGTVYERHRLYEEEKSLYEKIWLNEDGTRTLEYYGSPVKYYDKDGNILDKEYRIEETADSFVYEEDFKVIFPLSLSDGVKLIFENEEVTTKPFGLENTKRPYLSEDGRVLTYEINDKVSIEYLISDNGLKEYIVLKSYNGTEQYSSEIITNGLILEDDRLLNGEGELKAYLGEAIVFDKEERNNTIAEADTSLITKGRYLYTVTLTEDYLNSAEYPIRIDPSITLNTTGNIEDVSIVSTTTHSGTLGVLYIGRGASGAALRTLMRFPNLDLSGYTVNSAIISIRDVMCEHTYMDVECHEYTGNSWSENTTTSWSGCGSNMVGTIYDSHNVYYGLGNHTGDQQRYDFDITGLANKWADGTSQPSKGLIFKAPNTYESSGSKTYKTFGSINQGTSSYRPVLTVNYSLKFDGVYTLKNVGSQLYAQNTSSTSGSIVFQRSYDGEDYCKWEILPTADNYFTVKNVYTGLYMGVEGSSTSSGAAIKGYSTVENKTKWKFIATSSGNYRLVSKCTLSNGYSVAPPNSTDGSALYQYAYTDNNNYLDEWEVGCITNNRIYLDVAYDQAYINRFSDYYQRINNNFSILQTLFFDYFNIWIVNNGIYSIYSYADINCSTSYNQLCNHATDTECSDSILFLNGTLDLCTYHHNNIYNNLYRIQFPLSVNNAKMVFFGHDNCINGLLHEPNPFYGLTVTSKRLIMISNFGIEEQETKTVFHEFGHLFNAPDHYGIGCESTNDIILRTGDNRFSCNCIYGENKDDPDIFENLIICDGCRAIIMSNADNYNQ